MRWTMDGIYGEMAMIANPRVVRTVSHKCGITSRYGITPIVRQRFHGQRVPHSSLNVKSLSCRANHAIQSISRRNRYDDNASYEQRTYIKYLMLLIR